jgi:hypothetical protein
MVVVELLLLLHLCDAAIRRILLARRLSLRKHARDKVPKAKCRVSTTRKYGAARGQNNYCKLHIKS